MTPLILCPLPSPGGVFFTMMPDDTKQLLRDYARDRSEEAFRALVKRHSPVVYGAALRKLGGNRAAAQDVTQEVFTLLARKANGLESVVLGGWLYRQACRRAANHVRSESRRKRRESIVMENQSISSAPDDSIGESLVAELDDALLALPEKDRDALILRFFEGKEFRMLGTALGLSEEAARKRVARALERLAGNLKRRGIAVGSVSLGTAMQGFGASHVPASVIAAVSETTLNAGASTLFSAWIKPAAAGVVATSLVAGTTLAMRAPDGADKHVQASFPPAETRGPRPSRPAESLPQDPTLEQIITEIRRIRSSPGNALTALRLNVAVAKIRIERIPEFIRLGNDRLNLAERQEIYQPLLTNWWNRNPDAALTFMLVEKIGPKIKGVGENYLLGELFRRWVERDRPASEAWLVRNWQDETLQGKHGNGSFANFLSMWITGDFFRHGDVDGVFAFAMRLPTVADQAGSIAQLAGLAPFHTRWTYSEGSKDQWRAFYRKLEKLPDPRSRDELIRGFWKLTGETQAGKAGEILDFIQPEDPFMASLGLLCVKSLEAESKPDQSGSISITSTPVTDRDQREAKALEVGIRQGMNRSQILNAMAETMADSLKPEDFFIWLDSRRGELEVDDFLAAKARERAVDGASSIRGRQAEAIQWAERISDAELRSRLCRGAFRMMLVKRRDFANAYLAGENVPQNLVPDLLNILNEEP